VTQGKYAPRNSYSAIVLHITGYGPVGQYKSGRYKSPMDAAVGIYQRMPYAPHYVIDQDGIIVQMCPEELATWHVGGSNGRRYTGAWAATKFKWWADKWSGLGSPRELAAGKLWQPYPPDALKGPLKYFRKLYWASRHGSVNANTIGIEVIPPSSNPKATWSLDVWRAVVQLCQDISHRRGTSLDAHHLISHSDADPISRTTRSGEPWDTWSSQFSYGRFVVQARNLV